jgi:uncharacterized protein with PIN domain
MLGSLARHLRALGFDTQLQRIRPDEAGSPGERILVTRNRLVKKVLPQVILLASEKLPEQFQELRPFIVSQVDPDLMFTRCLSCNFPLLEAKEEDYKDKVPEYIQTIHKGRITYCGSCKRFFWPGTHRKNMEEKFKRWGLV